MNGTVPMDLRVLSRSGPPVGLADGSLTVMSRETGGAEVGLDHLTSLGHNSQTLDTSRRSQTLERKLKRRKCVADNMTVPMGMTYLEARSVKQPTMADYTKRFHEFRAWADLHQLLLMKPEDLDLALVEFLQELFDRERGVNDGVRVVAACKFLPATHCKGARNQSSQGESRFEGLEFGRTTSAKDAHASGGDGSSSWNLNERVQDQHGYPDVLPIHHLSEARGMQLFDSQAVSPTARDGHPALQSLGHSPPSIGGSDSGENQHFRCVGDSGFRPMARRLSQKHDAREEAVRRLVDRLPCRISKSLQPRTANPEARQSGNDVVCHRHGGATHDVLSRRRSLLEVKQHGRWASDNSLKRYVKEARLQTEVAKVPEPIRLYGLHFLQLLPDLLTQARKVPKPPVGISL